MGVEPLVGFPDQPVVESPLTDTGLVARHEQDRLSFGVERKGYAPDPTRYRKPELFHVGVARSVQRIHPRSPEHRAEFLKQVCMGKQFVLNSDRQIVEFRVEGILESNNPAHEGIEHQNKYAVKRIFLA